MAALVNNSLRYGDDALKGFANKIRNIELPTLNWGVELAGTSLRAGDSNTVGNLLDNLAMKFSGKADDVT